MSTSTSDLTTLWDTMQSYFSNFAFNVSSTFSNLALRDYIRLVWIIGGYLFLRPYLDMGFRKLLEKGNGGAEDQAQVHAGQATGGAAGGGVSPNAVQQAADNAEGEGEGEDEDVPQWGKSARRRQRKYMELVEENARRLKEDVDDDDDEDIKDLLDD